ncbi:hypothetical protein [Neisseria sp. CCUG12390]|uniref:hypothetical protein n=1 Tax=Neisseria sp. CCUG12390 TaxID=3392035 RepID=UPI003A101B5C
MGLKLHGIINETGRDIGKTQLKPGNLHTSLATQVPALAKMTDCMFLHIYEFCKGRRPSENFQTACAIPESGLTADTAQHFFLAD